MCLSILIYFIYFIYFYLFLFITYFLFFNLFLYFYRFFFLLILFSFILFFIPLYSFLNPLEFGNISLEVTIFWPFIFIFIFVTPLTLIYTFLYSKSDIFFFLIFVVFILIIGFGLFYTTSLFYFFIFYESFLLPSFFILYYYSKTRKALEASFLMFFWTQLGALFIIFNFQYLFFITGSFFFSNLKVSSLSIFDSTFLFYSAFFGFGVKFPIWPFYEWLPKAHVEASTNFSIFLSGVLVKFAFFGFLKYLIIVNLNTFIFFFIPILMCGIFDSFLKLFYQLDLKKLIAYATVMEMHWLTLAICFGYTIIWVAVFSSLIAHAFLSTNFFLLIDSVTRRFKTRLLIEISGLYYLNPLLYFYTMITIIIFLGFPGTLFFFSEFIFFISLLEYNMLIFIYVFFFAYLLLPSFFFKKWFILIFNSFLLTYSQNSNFKNVLNIIKDTSVIEIILFSSILLLIVWFGLSFQFFF